MTQLELFDEDEYDDRVMLFDEYQDLVEDMPLYDDCIYGLITEVGELVDIFKKGLRPNGRIDTNRIKDEAGDVLWYLTRLMSENNVDMTDVATHNIEKLNARHSG